MEDSADEMPENVRRLCCVRSVFWLNAMLGPSHLTLIFFTRSEDCDGMVTLLVLTAHGDEDDFVEGGYLVSPHSAVVRSLGA